MKTMSPLHFCWAMIFLLLSIDTKAETMVIKNVTVLPMHVDGQIARQDIFINGDRIELIKPSVTLATNANYTVRDGTGLYAIPGLWDAHVHLLAFNKQPTEEADTEQQAVALLQQMLRVGITSVVDMGMGLEFIPLAQKLKAREDLPNYSFAGPLISGKKTQWSKPIEAHITSEAEAKDLVKQLKDSGADFLKTYDGISDDLLRYVSEQARQFDLPIAGHIPFQVSTLDAVTIGIRQIQHTYLQLVKDCSELGNKASFAPLSAWMEDGYAGRWKVSSQIYRSRNAEECRNLYKTLANQQVFLVATPQLDLPLALVANELVLNSLSTELREGCDKTLSQQSSVAEQIIKDRLMDITEHYRELINAGVVLVAGSDAPNDCMGFGPSLVSTIQLYTQLGLSPFEALQTATINAAKMAGHDDQGSLKAGNRADIVLLKSNPLVNIDALNEVADVMIGGVWVKDVEGME